MRSKYIKNESGTEDVWMGQTLANGEVYEIESWEFGYWKSDSKVKASLKSGELIVVKDAGGSSPEAPYIGSAEFATIDEEEDMILLDHDGNILTDQNFNVATGADE